MTWLNSTASSTNQYASKLWLHSMPAPSLPDNPAGLWPLTDGNLGAHLGTLETAGHVAIEKDFVGKKPRTRIQLTRQGRRGFAVYVEQLRSILDGTSP